MALVLPMVVPSESFAQNPPGKSAGNVRAGVGPGGGGRSFSGGGVRNFGGGGGAPVARFNGGGGQRFSGGGQPQAQFRGGGNRYAGGGGYYRRGDRGFVGGAAVAGALVGGAIASQSYGYYDGGPAYAPGYYDDQSYYDDSSVVAVAPAPGGDDGVAYCTQTYRSYDPGSGTYLGFDGQRHPCP
jgi:hypothetical protein